MEKKEPKLTENKKRLPNNYLELIREANRTKDITVLQDLYKIRDINVADRYGDTLLHINYTPIEMVKWLVEQGADINLQDKVGKTPLDYQSNYPDRVEEYSKLGAKYKRPYIPPKPRQNPYRKQFHEFWNLLVPKTGEAETIQGEVIRIVGKVGHEVLDNGGINWNKNFSDMLQLLLKYFTNGIPLSEKDIDEVSNAKKQLSGGKCNEAAIEKLEEMSVKWVMTNSTPIKNVEK